MRATRHRPGTEQERFRHASYWLTERLGSHWTFLAALLLVLAWLLSGPLFGFSDHWQLIINTATTVVTFLMVFVIQTTQNRDSKAIQLKLDELIRAQRTARNVFADLEEASEDELRHFTEEFRRLRAQQGLSHVDAAHAASEHAFGRALRGDEHDHLHHHPHPKPG